MPKRPTRQELRMAQFREQIDNVRRVGGLFTCPGCQKLYDCLLDPPCAIPECDHIACRSCCETRDCCAVCNQEIWRPQDLGPYGPNRYFQANKSAVRLISEARSIGPLTRTPLTVANVAGWAWSHGNTNTHFDATPMTIIIECLDKSLIRLDNIFASDTIHRLLLMIKQATGMDRKDFDLVNKETRTVIFYDATQDGRPIVLSALKLKDGSILEIIPKIRFG